MFIIIITTLPISTMSSKKKKSKKKKYLKQKVPHPGKVVKENPKKSKELVAALKLENENSIIPAQLQKGEWPWVYETTGMKTMQQHLLFPNNSHGARFIIESLDEGKVNVLRDPLVGGESGRVKFRGAEIVVILMGPSMSYVLGEVYLTSSDVYHLWVQFENSKRTSSFEWPDYRACLLCPVCGKLQLPSSEKKKEKKVVIRSMFMNIATNIPNIGTRFIERLVCMECFDVLKTNSDGGHPEQLYNSDIFEFLTNNAETNNNKKSETPDFYTAINLFETFGVYGAIDKKAMELMQMATNQSERGHTAKVSKSLSKKKGDTVLKIDTSKKECIVCKKTDAEADGGKLKSCSRCKRVRYCSRECQVKDWKTHKKFCKEVQKANEMLGVRIKR